MGRGHTGLWERPFPEFMAKEASRTASSLEGGRDKEVLQCSVP